MFKMHTVYFWVSILFMGIPVCAADLAVDVNGFKNEPITVSLSDEIFGAFRDSLFLDFEAGLFFPQEPTPVVTSAMIHTFFWWVFSGKKSGKGSFGLQVGGKKIVIQRGVVKAFLTACAFFKAQAFVSERGFNSFLSGMFAAVVARSAFELLPDDYILQIGSKKKSPNLFN